jgi:hypothetical protein
MKETKRWRLLAMLLTGASLMSGGCTDEASQSSDLLAPEFVTVPSGYYDLTNVGQVTINQAVWISAVQYKVGTGVLNPFLDLKARGNATQEEGFNTDGKFQYDQHRTSDTNPLPLNVLPVVKYDGTFYREIILDANEPDSEPSANFSIDFFDLYLCPSSAATTYELYNEFEAGAGGCDRIYEMDQPAIGTDDYTSGSGNSLDYVILIPEAAFTGSSVDIGGCTYDPSGGDCGVWVILKAGMGAAGGDFVVEGTFEEFASIIRPWITVTKEDETSWTREHVWTITKDVTGDSEGHTAADNPNQKVITLLPGESGYFDYVVRVDETEIDKNFLVNGSVSITNPSDDPVMIGSITSSVAFDTPVTFTDGLVCTGLTLPLSTPVELGSGETITCTHTIQPAAAVGGTNTVMVSIVDGATTSVDADFVFSAEPTAVEGYPEINVTDLLDTKDGAFDKAWGPVSDDTEWTYRREPFTCTADEGLHNNVATIVETGDHDAETVEVLCIEVAVTKDAETWVDREYQWDITKTVRPAEWHIFEGDLADSYYTITLDKLDEVIDTNPRVKGKIYIENTGTTVADLFNVLDQAGGITGTVHECSVGGVPHPVPTPTASVELGPGEVMECAYTTALPSATPGTNTANVWLDAAGSVVAGPATAAYDFDDPYVDQEINAQVTVYDDRGTPGVPDDDAGFGTFSDDAVVLNDGALLPSFSCQGREYTDGVAEPYTVTNTAWIQETGDEDSATVTVHCYQPLIEKDATPAFVREHDWDIEKVETSAYADESTETTSLMLADGQSFQADYVVTPIYVGFEDSGFAVSGTITIQNPNAHRSAEVTAVWDEINGTPVDVLDCGTLSASVPSTTPLVCSYSHAFGDTNPDDEEEGLINEATGSRQAYAYNPDGVTGPLGVVSFGPAYSDPFFFDTPTTVLDECADVDDSFEGPLGQVCVADMPTSFSYSRTFQEPCSLEPYEYPNTATITEVDSGEMHHDSWLVVIDIPCTGCTLTQGYWKTHSIDTAVNPDFKGPPFDATWYEIGPLGSASPFKIFEDPIPTHGYSWYEVFWTAPKGGNVWLQLAHQWMAAYLNTLKPMDPAYSAELQGKLDQGQAILEAWEENLVLQKGKNGLLVPTVPKDHPDHAAAQDLASWLAEWNEGMISPPHCTEDGLSDPGY